MKLLQSLSAQQSNKTYNELSISGKMRWRLTGFLLLLSFGGKGSLPGFFNQSLNKFTMQVETFLPLFPGFYETQFEFNDEDCELEYINEKRAEIGLKLIGYDDVKWSYHDYRQNVCKKAVGYIETKLNELGIECNLTFKKLQSPREYNFETDMIIIDAEFDPQQVCKTFMDVDSDALPGFFERFLPSPGFSPFSETVKKAELSYWQETSFDNFHDFGLACELILSSHADSEFYMEEFIEKSTHEVEMGIDNYSDLVPND